MQRMEILPPDAALRLAAIVESSEDAIVSKDLNGIVTSWNRAAEQLFGYTPEEAIGRSITLIIPHDRLSEEDMVLSRVRSGQRVDHFETVRRKKDGTPVEIALTVSPIRDGSGRIVGASKIARDISEQKRAERELLRVYEEQRRAREAADHAREQSSFLADASAVLAASLDYGETLKAVAQLAVPTIADWCAVDMVNDHGARQRIAIAHVDPSKVALVQRLEDDYPARADDPRGVQTVIRSGKPVVVSRITADLVDQAARDDAHRALLHELHLTSYMCVPMMARGKPFGALTLISAESGREYHEDDLPFARELAARASFAIENARAYARATEASRLKDEFLATLSHELRTPLNAVLGYARLLRLGTLGPEKSGPALDAVERNATSLKQIIDDVLDVSRIVAGRMRLNVQPVELPIILENSVATLMPAADAKGVRVETVLESQPPPIAGDPDRLHQVVWNLLSNAIKFTPRGGKVQMRLACVNSHVEITVSDTGIGISPDFLPLVFERFRQADATFSREQGGLGLGLAIARQLTELHGGRITVASPGIGKGTTFTVQLPLSIINPAESDLLAQHPRSDQQIPTLSSAPRLDGIHVLAVDDQADSLNLLCRVLEDAGAAVMTSVSGPAALDAIRTHHPDVLLADIGMPGMDGLQLIRALRQMDEPFRSTPAAALTAYARAQDRVASLASGFQMHLVKPIDPLELVVAVSTLAPRRTTA
jgi:PAS domain S-box-containing protein